MKLLKIGITGGIGSGKSRVASIFESLGYAVYLADDRAKLLMHTDPVVVASVTHVFGKEAYFPDGKLNRAYLGGIVFADPKKLQELNKIVHPATGKDFQNWVAAIPDKYGKQLVFKEAAILFESGAYLAADGVITVYAPKSIRIERVMNRDKVDEASVLARMDKQWPEMIKIQRADFVIVNDGKTLLAPQIRNAIQFFNQ
ncbi:UNVERIFIED_CONTAM: hypothetical protein GTU68_004724 [Idotea baltica]|nr:hypothetical protein [Idotea baltica]